MLARSMESVHVYKFGGVAMGSAEALRVAAAHVRVAAAASAAGGRRGRRHTLVVVVSAMNGVTDLLLGAARAALARNREAYEAVAAEFEARHVALVGEVLRKPQRMIEEVRA